MKPNQAIPLVLVCLSTSLQAQPLFSDSFNYPDGPLVGSPGSPWNTHSGTTGQVDVQGGRLFLTQAEGEDVNATLAGAPFSSKAEGELYASFTLSLSELPSGGGTYFAHFKDSGNSFRGRLFVSTDGASPDHYRLGIGNGAASGATSGQYNLDLSLNEPVRVVARYGVASGVGTLWLNPTSEFDFGVTASDTPSPIDVSGFAFRQSQGAGGGMGAIYVDDLLVGASFGSVVPEPNTVWLLGIGILGLLVIQRFNPGRTTAPAKASARRPDER